MSLEGRRALVTGGAGHIGSAVCETLLELGAHVAVSDLNEDACHASVCRLSRADRAVAVPCDLRSESATGDAVRQVVARWDGLEIIVHCAAFVGASKYLGWAVPFHEQSVEAWDAAFRVNVTAAFVLAQAAADALSVSGHGAICLVGSVYGLVGPDVRLYEGTAMANPVGYGASKGAVIQLTRYLATLLAPRVRVNCVSPGGIFRRQPDVFVRRYQDRTPLKRMGTEEDIQGAVGFLVSDASAYVTGHNLVVDGGWTIV